MSDNYLSGRVKEVDNQSCLTLLHADSNISILDVRHHSDYGRVRIPGALNIDILGSNSFEKISKLPRDTQYLIYCDSGARSKSAVKLMIDMGFKNLYILVNGISHYTGPIDTTLKSR